MSSSESPEVKVAILETQLKSCLEQVEKLQSLTSEHALVMRDLLNKQSEILDISDKNGRNYEDALKTITNLNLLVDRLDRDLVRCKTEVETLTSDVVILKSLPIDELKTLPLKVGKNQQFSKVGGVIAATIFGGLITLIINIMSNFFKVTS